MRALGAVTQLCASPTRRSSASKIDTHRILLSVFQIAPRVVGLVRRVKRLGHRAFVAACPLLDLSKWTEEGAYLLGQDLGLLHRREVFASWHHAGMAVQRTTLKKRSAQALGGRDRSFGNIAKPAGVSFDRASPLTPRRSSAGGPPA
jgi:hypothetical protein